MCDFNISRFRTLDHFRLPRRQSAMFCICGGGSTVSATSALIISASLIIGATNNDIICLPFSCMIFSVSFQVSIFGVVAQSNLAC